MVSRIVRFDGPDGARLYELAFEALAAFQAGPREATAASAYEKLASIGIPKPEKTGNPDLVLMTLNDVSGSCHVELMESERDIVLDAIAKVPWPTFALARKARVVALLENAEKVQGAT